MNKTRNILVWIVLLMVMGGLLGFGTANFSGSVTSMGQVGDKDIPVRDYATALRQQISTLERQTGEQISFAQLQALGLDRQVLAGVVGRKVLENEADTLGVSVGDAYVRDAILEVPAFQGANGFDRTLYKDTLRNSNTNEEAFETSIRDEAARGLLQQAVLSGVTAPAGFADAVIDFGQQSRDITFAPVGEAQLSAPVGAPSEDQIQAYYDAHTADFTAPEQRRISAAALTPMMLADTLELDETALRALYDERADQYQRPARRLVERLAFASAEAADSARARLDAGEATFDALVTEAGLTLADIDLGDVTQAQLGAAGAPVFAAIEGAVAGPVMSRVGPALFRVNGVLEADITPYEDALPDLREELAIARAGRVIDDRRGAIEDLLAGGATLEDLAERTDMQLSSFDWTPESDHDLASYEAISTAIPALTEGALPNLIELADGGIAALRLDGVTAAAPKPLDSVRPAVAEAWRAAEIARLSAARATELAAQISAGADFAALGLEPMRETGLTRRAYVAEGPAELITRAFDTPVGTAVALDGAGHFVLRVDGEGMAEILTDDRRAAQARLNDSIAQSISADLFDAYAGALQQGTEVTLDQAAINAVHGSFQ